VKQCKYLIVGGGMTADSAVRGIRKIDQGGSIVMICDERHPPYDRPPLSKSLWKDASQFESIWRDFSDLNVTIHTGKKVVALDPVKKTVSDDAGNIYAYEKLLLATGGSVRHLPYADEGVIYFRTADDYLKLRELSEQGADFVVIGGGFIGSEIAAALAMNGKQVTMIFPSGGIGSRAYPPSLAEFLTAYYRDKGITMLAPETVKSVRTAGGKIIVTTGKDIDIRADGVVAGLGIQPNTGLAEQAGLAVDNGIVVDESLRTSDPDIYAAGDVANFYCFALEKRMRVEHEDNANVMGDMAGRNMAGQSDTYRHLPFFYSDLFDLGYEAVGELDAGLDIVEDWKEPFRKGVVYYLRDGYVRGVLLWNTWGQVAAATRLIEEKSRHTRATLLGRITD
jgi:NADPH-dependent 2,4-dienoyl-CoA reductase/sulfur reductase-like enzyme